MFQKKKKKNTSPDSGDGSIGFATGDSKKDIDGSGNEDSGSDGGGDGGGGGGE